MHSGGFFCHLLRNSSWWKIMKENGNFRANPGNFYFKINFVLGKTWTWSFTKAKKAVKNSGNRGNRLLICKSYLAKKLARKRSWPNLASCWKDMYFKIAMSLTTERAAECCDQRRGGSGLPSSGDSCPQRSRQLCKEDPVFWRSSQCGNQGRRHFQVLLYIYLT